MLATMTTIKEIRLSLVLPLRIRISKSTKGKLYALNLNVYRNLHFQILSKLKIHFKELIAKDLKEPILFKQPTIVYTLYTGSNRKSDLMNWVSVIDKFLEDALVENNALVGDDVSSVKSVQAHFGGVDKGHERMEVEIFEVIKTPD
jgi:hypothetical protein